MRKARFWWTIVPVLAALLLSFTTRPKDLTNCYAVCSTDANYYYTCGNMAGKIEGVDFSCIDHPTAICIICSDAAPDIFGRIPKAFSSVLVYGEYWELGVRGKLNIDK